MITLTRQKLDELWNAWNSSIEDKKCLRFGQYVFNKIEFETDSSYNIKDANEAYCQLLAAVNYASL